MVLDSCSVVITHYSRIEVLSRAVKSVLNQGIIVSEVLVVDDCSPRVSVSDIAASLPQDNRIRILQTSVNSGAQRARNLGISEANSEFIALLDCDDEWLDGKLQLQVDHLRKGNFDIVSCLYIKRGAAGGSVVQDRPKRFSGCASEFILESGGHLPTSTLLGRSLVIKEVGFDTSVKKFQDWDFLIRAEGRGFKIGLVDSVLSVYHFGGLDQMTARPNPVYLLEMIHRWSTVLHPRTVAVAKVRVWLRMRVESGEIGFFEALKAFWGISRATGRIDLLGLLLLLRKLWIH